MKVKTNIFFILLIIGFSILWTRLFYLQIISGKKNKVLADENRIRIIKTPALRGVIYDINGEVLARNRPEGREYVYGEALAHVLGYVGEVSQEELEQENDYELGDIIGKMGIEKQYDTYLRGTDGGVLVETDTQGEVVREIKSIKPKAGNNIYLSLNLDLQKKAFGLIEGKKGAIVAGDPKTGEVLALVSSPSFDPNIFSQSNSTFEVSDDGSLDSGTSNIEKILTSPDKPMFNRSLAGLYPPGSTFKIITAIAGLEEGKINKETEVEDTGVLEVGDFSYANWYFTQYGKTEGMVDIVKAIQRSNDIFFYKTGEWVGIHKLAEWASFFGLSQETGIDIPGEAIGLMPTPEWKKQQKMESWYLGDTYITAIGQGNILTTPIQINQATSVIASGGKLCQPHLVNTSEVSQSDSSDGEMVIKTVEEHPKKLINECQDLPINPVNLKLVKEGMKLACSTGGTGWPFFDFEPTVGCKTGTAEYGDPQDRTHAWFTVFAPWDNPEIVVTVLLEAAGEGSYESAPVAKEILKWWFEKKGK